MSCRDGHLVHPDRVDDDPQDREEPERGALGPGKEGLPDGHPVDRDGDHDAHRERYQRRYPGGDLQRAEQDEEQEQWQCRNRGAPRERVGDRIKNLLVHGLASIVTSDTLLEIPYCIPSNAASRWPIRARAGSCSSRSRSGCRAVADGGARDRPARTRPDWGRRRTRPNRLGKVSAATGFAATSTPFLLTALTAKCHPAASTNARRGTGADRRRARRRLARAVTAARHACPVGS